MIKDDITIQAPGFMGIDKNMSKPQIINKKILENIYI